MNNDKKRKINLMPLFILIALLIVVYFVFLKDSDLLKIDKSPEVTRVNGFPTVVYGDKEVEKERSIITNAQELSEFLNKVDDSGYLMLREEIDFNKNMLLAVSTSTNEVEGAEIKIKKLYEDKDNNKLIVSVRETEPGETCELIPHKNVAVDLAAISITTREIEFERVKEIVECE